MDTVMSMPMVSEDFGNLVWVFTSVPVLVASLSEMQLHHERTESNMLNQQRHLDLTNV
jgi:hypothetical protein